MKFTTPKSGHSPVPVSRFMTHKILVERSKTEKWPLTFQGLQVYAQRGVNSVYLPRLAGEATGGSPATVSRFEPGKKVWLKLLASAGEWPLFKPAAYGWCSPVSGFLSAIPCLVLWSLQE